MEKELRITNDLKEITVLVDFVKDLCEELALPIETEMNINLALEEAVVNVIMYAYPVQEPHDILLKVSSDENQLIFLLTDKGSFFDPTMVADADLTLSIEERPIGGFSILLIRCIINEVSYQRLGSENLLTMKKSL